MDLLMTMRSLCLGVMAVLLAMTVGLLISRQRLEWFEENRAGRVAEDEEERNQSTSELTGFVAARGRKEVDAVWVSGERLDWMYGAWTSALNPADGYIEDVDVPGRGDGSYQLVLSDSAFSYQFGSPYAGSFGLPGAHWSARFTENPKRFQLSFADDLWFEYDDEADTISVMKDDGTHPAMKRVRTESFD